MAKNITLRMDENLLQRARHVAVDHNLSLSAWVASLVDDALKREAGYEAAKARALERLQQGFALAGRPLTREESHAR